MPYHVTSPIRLLLFAAPSGFLSRERTAAGPPSLPLPFPHLCGRCAFPFSWSLVLARFASRSCTAPSLVYSELSALSFYSAYANGVGPIHAYHASALLSRFGWSLPVCASSFSILGGLRHASLRCGPAASERLQSDEVDGSEPTVLYSSAPPCTHAEPTMSRSPAKSVECEREREVCHSEERECSSSLAPHRTLRARFGGPVGSSSRPSARQTAPSGGKRRSCHPDIIPTWPCASP